MESVKTQHEGPAVADSDIGEGPVFAFPASLSQVRFWELDQPNPGNPAYNVAVRFCLEGKLNVETLEQSFNAIICRHEVLRATFRVENGELVQVISPYVAIRVPVVDLRRLPDAHRHAETDRLSIEEAERSFDVSVGPLFRASLIRLDDEQHILLVTVHHLVSDGWSVGLITNELGAIYAALSEGREPLLSELPIQYTDFAVWQKDWLQDSSLNQQLSYWKKQLDHLTPLSISTDRVRPPRQTFHGHIVSTVLPRSLTDAIQQYSARNGSTFFVTVLSGFKLLLHLYSGQTDIGIGTQVAGRNRVELENLIGLFINTVILRTHLSGDPTIRDLMDRVRDTVLQSVANQDVPFEKVLKALSPALDPSRNPLFQVNFICQRDFVKPLQFSGLTLTAIPSKSQGALYDLNVFLVERADGWRLSCEYNTDLFEQATAERILEEYRALLEEVIEHPEKKISEFARLAATPAQPSEEDRASDAYVLPVSQCQHRFWLLDRLMPGNPAFNMPVAVAVKGCVDLPALQQSIDDLVERHEALRTAFAVKDGEPAQLVAPQFKIRIQRRSLEHLPECDREAEATRLLEESARAPFDLGKRPLLRIDLLRLAHDHHFLMLCMPHVICDGWSNGILVRELWSLYESHSTSVPAVLPEVRIQYGDFALWENQWLEGDFAQESLAYWKEVLQGQLPILDVPTDRPAVFGKIPRGGMETLLFPTELTAALKNLCKREHVTMFVLCLAAFKTLLHHYTGQDDVLVGSPVANRTPDTEAAIGPFSNPVCLRSDLSGNPTFRELLVRMRASIFEALDHKDLPVEKILPEIAAPSLNGRNSVFQFYFYYQAAFLQPIKLSNLEITPLPTFSPGASFEWQLGFIKRPEGLRAQLQYNADLYNASTIARVLRLLQAVLEKVVAAPEQRIQEISVLSEDDRRRIAEWRESHSRKIDRAKNYVAPRNAVEQQLAGIWQEALKFKPVSVTASFFDLGGNSLQLVELLLKIERSFKKTLSLSSFVACPTIEQMALFLEGETSISSETGFATEPLLSRP